MSRLICLLRSECSESKVSSMYRQKEIHLLCQEFMSFIRLSFPSLSNSTLHFNLIKYICNIYSKGHMAMMSESGPWINECPSWLVSCIQFNLQLLLFHV